MLSEVVMTTHPILMLDYLQGTSWDPQNSSSELHNENEEDIGTQVRSKMKTFFFFFLAYSSTFLI